MSVPQQSSSFSVGLVDLAIFQFCTSDSNKTKKKMFKNIQLMYRDCFLNRQCNPAPFTFHFNHHLTHNLLTQTLKTKTNALT